MARDHIPSALHELASCLDRAAYGIDEQLEMAARGGSDMALALVKSWYPQVQVGMLADGFRTGTSLASLRPEICMVKSWYPQVQVGMLVESLIGPDVWPVPLLSE